ncbi:hypothetical protein [Flavobacterium sp.]|uniref:hypothetical protein n=1 Tax=Flavobacterium sp. TaxID=239 RepID=UPI00286DF736|nr:hypothetical protein [Flavobacterium sp.]
MWFEKINIETKLAQLQSKTSNQIDVLEQVKTILNQDEATRVEIKSRVIGKFNTISNDFDFDLLERDKIFHIDSIKSICVDYRLRFLDSHLFKNDIPEEAISKIKNLEKSHQTKLEGFRIMAPAKLFKLKNYDDPLLFAPIGNDYYYLIHKWGNDINPFRKLLMLPFKSLSNSMVALIVLSILTTLILPVSKFGPDNINVVKFISFLFVFKSYCAIFLYYSFWKGKNFSSEIWNSTFYN